ESPLSFSFCSLRTLDTIRHEKFVETMMKIVDTANKPMERVPSSTLEQKVQFVLASLYMGIYVFNKRAYPTTFTKQNIAISEERIYADRRHREVMSNIKMPTMSTLRPQAAVLGAVIANKNRFERDVTVAVMSVLLAAAFNISITLSESCV